MVWINKYRCGGLAGEKRKLETESASGISMKLLVIILNRAYGWNNSIPHKLSKRLKNI